MTIIMRPKGKKTELEARRHRAMAMLSEGEGLRGGAAGRCHVRSGDALETGVRARRTRQARFDSRPGSPCLADLLRIEDLRTMAKYSVALPSPAEHEFWRRDSIVCFLGTELSLGRGEKKEGEEQEEYE